MNASALVRKSRRPGYALLLVALAALLSAPLQAGRALAKAPAGTPILTVTGAVEASNRPAFEAFRDALFAAQNQIFEKAYAFDRAMLAALPQEKVTTEIEGWPGPLTLKGPLLSDVLSEAGVAGEAKVTLFALDGYNVALAASDRSRYKWILAIEAGGEPLALGGRGPLWLVRDTGGAAAPADAEAPMVWAIYHIKAE